MSEVRKYVERYPQIEALVWTGDNVEEMRAFIGASLWDSKLVHRMESIRAFSILSDGFSVVMPGDYVVKSAMRGPCGIGPDHFDFFYAPEPAQPTSPAVRKSRLPDFQAGQDGSLELVALLVGDPANCEGVE